MQEAISSSGCCTVDFEWACGALPLSVLVQVHSRLYLYKHTLTPRSFEVRWNQQYMTTSVKRICRSTYLKWHKIKQYSRPQDLVPRPNFPCALCPMSQHGVHERFGLRMELWINQKAILGAQVLRQTSTSPAMKVCVPRKLFQKHVECSYFLH